MAIKIVKIKSDNLLEQAFTIRKEVFVQEQKVPERDELDQYENESVHFLAYYDAKPIGTARWRKTKQGLKLERFAVKKAYRNTGIGSALVQAILADIKENFEDKIPSLYLHAQVGAVYLYEKFGFEIEGDQFDECGIMHYKMKKKI
ncbi:MAG: GNAT family N-acetyltransferase [Candidatus Cyclobacteriaceae bacterium M3_2C_046]